jgi:hypothetical protein
MEPLEKPVSQRKFHTNFSVAAVKPGSTTEDLMKFMAGYVAFSGAVVSSFIPALHSSIFDFSILDRICFKYVLQ